MKKVEINLYDGIEIKLKVKNGVMVAEYSEAHAPIKSIDIHLDGSGAKFSYNFKRLSYTPRAVSVDVVFKTKEEFHEYIQTAV